MGKKVLIVDDNETVRTLLRMSLRKSQLEVLEASDGEKGFEIANTEKPDLIISDVLMPKMDGFEFCRKVREQSSIPTVPFIFLTSLAEVSTEVRGYRTGADDYLVKSNIKRENLIEKVEAMLAKSNEYKRLESVMHDGLVGNLTDLNIIELIQLLGMNKKSGALFLTTGSIKGEVYFVGGRILHAQTENLVGEDAIYKLAEWNDGLFKFEPKEIVIEPTIRTTTMNLIMEACRRMDEKKSHS
jgi:DNA-binding response OmpR family regulator